LLSGGSQSAQYTHAISVQLVNVQSLVSWVTSVDPLGQDDCTLQMEVDGNSCWQSSCISKYI